MLTLALAIFPAAARATTYYVDSRVGDDRNAGTTPSTAWRSLAHLGRVRFAPGDSILFARGASWTGGVAIDGSGTAERPIVIGSYGSGDAPSFTNPDWGELNGNIFRIEGSHVVIQGLYFHDNTDPPTDDNRHHDVQKMGAVYLGLRADSDVVRDCEFVHTPVAIKVKGRHDLITRNYMHDAPHAMQRTWGPIAIMVVSADNEISYNRITNYGYYGGAYGSDGGAIELDGVDDAFDGRNVRIHHNVSIGNHGFLELAGKVTDSITVAYNLSDDVDKFIGGGAMKHTVVVHNTVIRTREPNVDRWIFWTFYPESTSFVVDDDIFVVPRDIQVFPRTPRPAGHRRTGIGDPEHSRNVYFSAGGSADPVGVPLGEGDIIADPRFVDLAHGDYRLRPDSPAKGRGAPIEQLPALTRAGASSP
ncbi:MAG TPA: hypothetical protein VF041_03275 [Gemmatimonadaceae bacterium]